MDILIHMVVIFVCGCAAYIMGHRDAARKFTDALWCARELYRKCDDEPVHRLGAFRFDKILQAQLYEKELL